LGLPENAAEMRHVHGFDVQIIASAVLKQQPIRRHFVTSALFNHVNCGEG
jgi:hypothetical protein